MSAHEPPPGAAQGQIASFARVTDAAAMMRAVLDAPGLSDYQRMFGQGVVWSRLLGPALERIDGYRIDLIRASLDVAEAATAFRDAGSNVGAGDPSEIEAALERLDAALDRLEALAPVAQVEQAGRAEEFLEMLRAEIPSEG